MRKLPKAFQTHTGVIRGAKHNPSSPGTQNQTQAEEESVGQTLGSSAPEEYVTDARLWVDSGSKDGSEEKGGHKLSSEHDNQIF